MADSDGGCIVMEFGRMHPGASDEEFRLIFAKIAEAANVQHDDDLASLSAALLPKRSRKHLVETVDSIEAKAAKNPALTNYGNNAVVESGEKLASEALVFMVVGATGLSWK
eukprot:gene11414-biopygen9097